MFMAKVASRESGWGWVAKSASDLSNKGFLDVSLLLTYGGASVPRYDSAFHPGMFDVRAKHFRQEASNSKILTLCNQKH